MAVLRPLRVVIENFPEGKVEHFEAQNHPEHPERGTRRLPFSRVLYVERDDFREDAPKKWYRLAPGREVRLRYACLVTCRDIVRDERGEVTELVCTWDPESRGGSPKDGRKVPGTLHWVDASQAVDAEVRLYERLFSVENPLGDDPDRDFTAHLNPASLEVLGGCKLEPSLADASPGDAFQFERLGYFCFDLESRKASPVVNRTIELRDSWAKLEQKLGKA
jgi:glutaminyl-tRNA synthetase